MSSSVKYELFRVVFCQCSRCYLSADSCFVGRNKHNVNVTPIGHDDSSISEIWELPLRNFTDKLLGTRFSGPRNFHRTSIEHFVLESITNVSSLSGLHSLTDYFGILYTFFKASIRKPKNKNIWTLFKGLGGRGYSPNLRFPGQQETFFRKGSDFFTEKNILRNGSAAVKLIQTYCLKEKTHGF